MSDISYSRLLCIVDKGSCFLDYNEEWVQSRDDLNLDDVFFGVSLIGYEFESLTEDDERLSLFTLEISNLTMNGVKSKSGRSYTHRFMDRFIAGGWFAILTVSYSESSSSYMYRAYGDDYPERINVESISFQSLGNPNFNNSEVALSFITKKVPGNQEKMDHSYQSDFKLIPYSVGQGMCSLLHDGKVGYLLDAGAGKPVVRKNYTNKTFNNELLSDIASLKELYLVLSHLDSDHFRLIRWDSRILSKVVEIFIPLGLSWIDSKEKNISGKITPIRELNVLSNNMDMRVIRTQYGKTVQKNNDEELIVFLSIDGHNVLYPGDYSYSSIAGDLNIDVSVLQGYSYSFLCVPHHGDNDSQYQIPCPSGTDSMAFFSAGNHASWKHPSCESVNEHVAKGYKPFIERECPDIKRISGYNSFNNNVVVT